MVGPLVEEPVFAAALPYLIKNARDPFLHSSFSTDLLVEKSSTLHTSDGRFSITGKQKKGLSGRTTSGGTFISVSLTSY